MGERSANNLASRGKHPRFRHLHKTGRLTETGSRSPPRRTARSSPPWWMVVRSTPALQGSQHQVHPEGSREMRIPQSNFSTRATVGFASLAAWAQSMPIRPKSSVVSTFDYVRSMCLAMSFINENLARDVSPDEIARAACFSKYRNSAKLTFWFPRSAWERGVLG